MLYLVYMKMSIQYLDINKSLCYYWKNIHKKNRYTLEKLRMKKLTFNKITKEITIKEEKKKIIQAKVFFEKYKIFFEIFSTVLLGIMSLIISFVGLKTNERSLDLYQKQLLMQQIQSEILQAQLEIQQEQSEIYQKQLEMQINDREPYFTIHCETIDEENYLPNTYYIIKNEGGGINLGYIWKVEVFFHIYLWGKDEYYYRINEAFLISKDSTVSLYDNSNKEFRFYGYDYLLYFQLNDELETELKSIYGSENISVSFESYFTMDYTNYKNERIENTYKFTSTSMGYVNSDYNDEKIDLGSMEYGADISSIAYDISEKIEVYQNNINP